MVLIVTTLSALVVPRSAAPEAVPAPQVSTDDVRATRRANEEAALRYAAAAPSDPVLRVGDALRALGRAEYEGDEAALGRASASLGAAAAVALRSDAEGLALLRSYQAELFARAYCAYLRTGDISDDLIELGGRAVSEFADNGWLARGAALPPYADLILSALFKRRFADLVGKASPALAGHPVEERLLLGYLVANPPSDRTLRQGSEGSASRFVMNRIDELSALDPSYPAAYARGVVLFKMREYELAALSFDEFLRERPDGPHRLRAVNYLKAALERCEGEP